MHRPVSLILAALITSGAAASTAEERAPAPAGSIVMLDSRTGEELWRLRGSNDRFHKGASVGSGAVLTVLDKCHGGSDAPRRSQVVALDARSGEPRWHSGERTYALGPARGGVAVLNAGSGATAGRDVESGDRLWRKEIGANFAWDDLVFGWPPDTPSPRAGLPWTRISAYESDSGKLRWTFPDANAPGLQPHSSIVAVEKHAVVIATTTPNQSTPPTYIVLDRTSGRLLSQITSQRVNGFRGAVAVDGLLVGMGLDQANEHGQLGFVTNEVIALDLTTGSVVWTKQLPFAAGFSAFLQRTEARQVVLLDNAGALRTVTAFDTHTGETLWSQTEAQVLAADSRITILDKNSYAKEGQPALQAVDTRSGEVVWDRPIPLARIGKLFASIDGRYVALSGGCS